MKGGQLREAALRVKRSWRIFKRVFRSNEVALILK